MFERLFAKYARAIDDKYEREELFKKFKTKEIVSIIFYALCVAVFFSALILSDYIEQTWAFALLSVIILFWIGFAIADLCLWLSFRKTYRAILERPAQNDEMPEITAYRQKTLEDKRSTFKKLLWAWIVFFVSIAAFLACLIVDAIQNPDSEEFGVWGGAAIVILLVGVMTLAISYVVYSIIKQQKGTTFEIQSASEAMKIDRAQGRKPVYRIESDKNLQAYKYLFPNRELYDEAETVRKKYSKILIRSLIPLIIIVVVAAIFFLCSEQLGQNIAGYTFPALFTFMFVWIVLFSLPMNNKLTKIEKKQKAELETNPEYAQNLQWYRLYSDFSKFKGKIYIIFCVMGIALGWILTAFFPTTPWSVTGLIPIVIGLLVNRKLVKDLRQKAIPIENEIDKKELALHDVRFYIADGAADENTVVFYDGDCILPKGKMRGEITLYLENTYVSLGVDDQTGQVLDFSSGMIFLSDFPHKEIALPENIFEGALFVELKADIPSGTGWRINFDGDEQYDKTNKIYLVGNVDSQKPYYKIYKNVFVQISDDGVLLAVLCTDIAETTED